MKPIFVKKINSCILYHADIKHSSISHDVGKYDFEVACYIYYLTIFVSDNYLSHPSDKSVLDVTY